MAEGTQSRRSSMNVHEVTVLGGVSCIAPEAGHTEVLE